MQPVSHVVCSFFEALTYPCATAKHPTCYHLPHPQQTKWVLPWLQCLHTRQPGIHTGTWMGLGSAALQKRRRIRSHCQSNILLVWGPEGLASHICADHGVPEDERMNRMRPCHLASHVEHLEGHLVDAIPPKR